MRRVSKDEDLGNVTHERTLGPNDRIRGAHYMDGMYRSSPTAHDRDRAEVAA
ncbi:MAG TPA: hypothetical protein VJ487_07575 [Alphaproteobacteria bacterium]|nr:hypothetical protein [Alphaproteobacteria bacterium]